ncbi:hypothetical protein Q648_00625 [Bartonella quintana JK 12]|uniref:Uncharacterized protein n=2 Tax=Bartonella quintana TaxID=803 RepID=W3TXM9_BARQI|nr:hypothetical protein Q651_01119 [Bartonella quintana BQ2-D70]ETS14400.1 hypothetical protein Q650_01039 [Bartonella quintana JK 73rel]ETS16086.1 hypothetical protein Q649_01047 [Bartonella quintana JK 73]ETS18089.1 hypothetical protein Q647_01036 [Bartonella quintana JK 7]ETS18918.1 hypothetical protein Q648_00625 [Bartonella quintana JK 12]KEC60610.1 hypothetical protein O91_01201 [Bartonella quintana JK 31]KEC61727.1 hypothetical protein O7Y_01030 [Bartonella quintana JK 63]KEC64461.1 h
MEAVVSKPISINSDEIFLVMCCDEVENIAKSQEHSTKKTIYRFYRQC